MKPLRIAYLIFSSGLGGGELLLLNHLSHHDPKHVTPLVVCSGEGALTERLRNLNIPVHILPINREREYFCRFSLPHIRTLLKLWIWLRRNQIDLIHSYTLETRNYAHAIALLSGLPLFHTSQDTWFGNMFGRAQWWAMNKIPKRIIVTSQTVSDSLKVGVKLRSTHVVMIRPGINLSHFSPKGTQEAVRAEFGIPPNSLIVGAVGRLSSVKGWDVFLSAAQRICQIRPDVHFLLVGGAVLADDDYVDSVARLIKMHQLNDRISMTGFRDDMPHLISVMDVLVSTSPRESFGLVLAEAGACGRPAVSVCNGGAQEIIVHGRTGLLVEVGDAVAVADAVLELLADPLWCQEMGQEARRHVEAEFDICEMVNRIEHEYLDVAKARQGIERPGVA